LGTSTKWDGPRGAGWSSLRRSIGQLGRGVVRAASAEDIPMPRQAMEGRIPPKAVEVRGRRFLIALEDELRRDPDAFGLRVSMGAAGARLIAALSDLHTELDAFGPPPENWAGSTADWFLCEFVRTVAGDQTGIMDAMVRRSATRCAEKILADSRAREAIDEKTSSSGLAMDLFCLIYTFFFADVVTEFAKAAVSEQVKLAVPGLVVIDPGGQIPDWIGKKVAALIPNPCEQKHQQGDDGRSITELAADVLWDNVDRVLGLTNDAET
jgi:hypothetical protein